MSRRRLRDYYRQFEALSPEENSQRLVARRRAEQSAQVERTPDLDLATTAWHQPPDPELVNAATFALRRAINRYPETADASPAVQAIAAHHGVPADHVVLGHGAGQLLQAALRELAAGGEAVLPWPSWSPLPALMRRAGVRPVPVPLRPDGAPDLPAMRAACGPDTRALVVCSPNDPTGALADPAELRAPVPLLVDEALIEFAPDGASAIGRDVIVFRSFSKAWALAGLRAGYAVGPGVGVLEPGQGVASPTQAAVVAALETPRRIAARRAAIATERARLAEGLAGTPFSVLSSDAHVVWLSGEGHTAAQLTAGLAEQRIHVASGAQWDDDRHVRVTLRDAAATHRLLAGLRALL